jgi:integrase
MSAVFTWAIKKGLVAKNPIKEIKKPREPEYRERFATQEERQRLMQACNWDGQSQPVTEEQLTVAAFLFACNTGMRSGEILKLEEAWIEGRVIHIPASAIKTESKRDVALSKEALRILDFGKAP